jgi:Flp pilus assembly protein TadG
MTRSQGNVVVEFVGVIVALLLPLSFLGGACWEVARTQLALRAAAHAASRAFVLSPSSSVATKRVAAVTSAVLRDAGVDVGKTRRSVVCTENPCLTPGGYVTVTLAQAVAIQLPGVGSWNAQIVATDTSVVDVLR